MTGKHRRYRDWETEVEDIGKFNKAYADLVDEFRDIDPSLPL